MTVLEWARSAKPSFVTLQLETGIPALWAAAQSCHESAEDGGASLSGLALNAHNYAGLKWAEWQREYGCSPVTYGTWECIDGQNVDCTDAFCSCPDWSTWLKVYAGLLTGRFYRGALAFKEDPMLYGVHIWQSGWATDPAYIAAVAGWMSRLYQDYADTLPGGRYSPVTVRLDGAVVDCRARLELGHTRMDLRPISEKLGARVTWDQARLIADITTGHA